MFALYDKRLQNTTSNFSLRKCNRKNNEIYTDNLYISYNYEAIFLQSLRHFQRTFAKVL
jgi:hypothetical protein